MIDLLKRNEDKSFEVVSEKEIVVGDIFVTGWNSTTKENIYQTVNNIHEQRKEKGTYIDESNRRMWAKVS